MASTGKQKGKGGAAKGTARRAVPQAETAAENVARTMAEQTVAAGEAASGQMMDAVRANMEVALRIAKATFEGAERMREIQLAAAKTAHAKAESMQRAVRRGSSPTDLWGMEQHALLENIQQAMAYWNELLSAAAQTNAAIAQILNEEVSTAQARATRGIEGAMGSLPSMPAMPAMPLMPSLGGGTTDWTSAVSAANSTYKQLWDNTSRMMEMLNANVRAIEAAARGGR
jgi:hypothetical protein